MAFLLSKCVVASFQDIHLLMQTFHLWHMYVCFQYFS